MPEPVISQLAVRQAAAKRGGFAADVSTPQSGATSLSWGLRIRGHMRGAEGVAAIEAVVPGRILATTRPGQPVADGLLPRGADEFTLLVDTLDLPLAFEFRLRATLADGSRVKFATISGRRQPLATSYQPRLQPLLITSLGRMGTTLLMQMLAAHPAVVAYNRPPFEARGGKYWAHLLRTLAAPADATRRVGAPMEFHQEPGAVSGNPFYSAEFDAWPQVEAWSGGAYIAELAAFCQRSIDGWYLATAAAQQQDQAPLRFFAEKHFPDDYPRRLRELYPAAQELFLVRDFRDMVASMLAYNARKGYGDFGRERAGSEAEWLAELRRGLSALHDAWRERGAPATLVRYEALVREPERALPPLLQALGLAHSPQIVAGMIAAAAPDAPDLRGHGTTTSPDASIGRWRSDLSPALRAAVAREFGDLLVSFGYDPEAPE